MPTARLARLLATGAYLQARQEAEQLLRQGGLSPGDEAGVAWCACRAARLLKEPFAAVKYGMQAVERAEGAGDWHALGKAHFDLGAAYALAGDTHLSRAHLEGFLTLLPEVPALATWEAETQQQLAAVCRQRRDWPGAAEHLGRAVALLAGSGRAREGARAALDLVWCHLMLRQPGAALPLLEAAEAFTAREPDDALAADLLCHRGLYHHLRGEWTASAELCQELFAPGRPGVGEQQRGTAAWILGENALALGRLQEASTFVEVALNHAARAVVPGLMNLAGDLRRRIAAASHNSQ